MQISVPFDDKNSDLTLRNTYIAIDLVRTQAELEAAFQLRRECFVIEKNIPEAKEFDGNDFASTHILATVNHQPAGTMRVRCFKDFAKMERLCVGKAFRGHSLPTYMLDYLEEYLIGKGYDCFVGYILGNLADFWLKRGFVLDDKPSVPLNDNLVLLPVKYPFSPKKIATRKQQIDLFAREGRQKSY